MENFQLQLFTFANPAFRANWFRSNVAQKLSGLNNIQDCHNVFENLTFTDNFRHFEYKYLIRIFGPMFSFQQKSWMILLKHNLKIISTMFMLSLIVYYLFSLAFQWYLIREFLRPITTNQFEQAYTKESSGKKVKIRNSKSNSNQTLPNGMAQKLLKI